MKRQDKTRGSGTIRFFLAGDVMLGRGIDQILPHPGDPTLHEGYVHTATGYVDLAEQRNGPIPRAVPFGYVWGDLSADLDARGCDLRLINLETAITTSDAAEPKGINYRMHPANAPTLSAARIDAVTLANNHTLDWGAAGLVETLEVLSRHNITAVGAGRTQQDANALKMVKLRNGRILLLAYGARGSGVPAHWRAGLAIAGINLLPDTADDMIAEIRRQLPSVPEAGDLVLVSIHWGGNWGYEVLPDERDLAHRLIDEAGVDIVHGHSSHHPRAAEVHNGRLILYGAGDLINDYEGISGHEEYRSDLVMAYIVDVRAGSGALIALELLPYRIRAFRLQRASHQEVGWLHDMMARECAFFGGQVARTEAGTLQFLWS
ncbi:MAG: CapA family protein [Paracoccaceae bacterium]